MTGSRWTCSYISRSAVRFSSPGAQPEHAGPAVAEQRLQDDVAVLAPERADFVAVAGQQGRRHQFPEAQHKQLFGGVAHRRRVVDDKRPVLRQQFEQMRRGDISHVEGRVLTHQHDVDAGEIELFKRAKAVMGARPPKDFERPAARVKPAVAQGQRVGQVMKQRMTAGLRFESEGKGRNPRRC